MGLGIIIPSVLKNALEQDSNDWAPKSTDLPPMAPNPTHDRCSFNTADADQISVQAFGDAAAIMANGGR